MILRPGIKERICTKLIKSQKLLKQVDLIIDYMKNTGTLQRLAIIANVIRLVAEKVPPDPATAWASFCEMKVNRLASACKIWLVSLLSALSAKAFWFLIIMIQASVPKRLHSTEVVIEKEVIAFLALKGIGKLHFKLQSFTTFSSLTSNKLVTSSDVI